MDFKEINELEKQINKKKLLLGYQGADAVVSSFQVLENLKERNKQTPVKTNIPALDALTDGGFRTPQVSVISGATGEGKTSFIQTLIHNFKKQDIHSVVFPFEGGQKDFLEKFPELPLFYLPQENVENNLMWLEERIIEAQLKYDIKIAFIDHLHYLVPLKESINMSLLIGGIMRELVLMAKRLNIIIFVAAHLKKIKLEADPTLDDLRDSSFIGQEATFVFFLKRQQSEEKNQNGDYLWTNKTKVFVGKNRWNGNKDPFTLIYNNNLFTEETNLIDIQF